MTITITHPILGVTLDTKPTETEPGDKHPRLQVIRLMDDLASTNAYREVCALTVIEAVKADGTDEEKAAILVRNDDPDAEAKFSPEVTDAFLARHPLWDSEDNCPVDDAPYVVKFSDIAIQALNELTKGGTWLITPENTVALRANDPETDQPPLAV